MAEKAIELDPDFGQASAWHSCILGQAWGAGYIEEEEVFKMMAPAAEALEAHEEDDAECHRILAELEILIHRNFEKARFHQDRAYALNPNDPRIVSQRGEILVKFGEAEEAIGWIEKAMRLDPSEADRRTIHLGMAHFATRNYQEAIDAFKRSPRLGHVHRAALAASHAALGNNAAVETEVARALEQKSDFSVKAELRRTPYQFEADTEHHRDALLKAGLPA